MVKLDVQVKATLENVQNLRLEEQDDWHFKIKCTACNEEAENIIYFNLVEKAKIEGSRGEANFIHKCKMCDRVGNVEYCKNSLKFYTKSEQFQTIASFECRNIELVEFIAGVMKADGIGGSEQVFDDIDLANEPDWGGYDEDTEQPVGVYEMKT